ncbi:hypothetical protein [Labilithrix luteola]|uniref:hypothetical protein n=1 Tax=Labilithrix luteola TaxID=1391654 RepID=UPI0011BAE0D9|nr:hypothetical protein [Labilithrix luteola]
MNALAQSAVEIGALALVWLGGIDLWSTDDWLVRTPVVVVLDERLPATIGASAQGHEVGTAVPVTVYYRPSAGACGSLESGDSCSTTALHVGATAHQFIQSIAGVCICR